MFLRNYSIAPFTPFYLPNLLLPSCLSRVRCPNSPLFAFLFLQWRWTISHVALEAALLDVGTLWGKDTDLF